jgi:fucose permease
MGCLDVSLNAQAAAVQAFYDRPVMSRFHGIYSLGALVGAGLGSIAAAQRLPIDIHLGVAGLLTLVAGEWATGAMVGKSLDLAKSARRFVRPDLELVVLGILGFCALLCEGAAADWSAVYLHVTLDQSVGVAGLGYVVFSAAMIAGRLAGDRLTERLGWRLLFRLSCLFAAVGFGVALLIGTPTSVLVGFGVLGAGVACAAPLVFSAAGRHRDPGPSMASVSTGSYFGFLAGPPIIGAIAASVGLASALAVVPFCAALAALLVGASVLTQSSREAKKGFAK